MDNRIMNFGSEKRHNKPCIHHLKGHCNYGDQCSFLHVENTQSPPAVHRNSFGGFTTSTNGLHHAIEDDKGLDIEADEPSTNLAPVCRYFVAGRCNAGDQCTYRHVSSPWIKRNWRTVPCKNYLGGSCQYGDRCSFIHSEPSIDLSHALSQPLPRRHGSQHLPPFLFPAAVNSSTSTPLSSAARVLPPPSSDPAHSGEEWRVRDPYLIPNPSPQPPIQADWSHPHLNPRSNTLTPNLPGSHSPNPSAYPSLSPLLPAPVFPTLHDTVEKEPIFPVLDYNDMSNHGLGFVLSPEEPEPGPLPHFPTPNGMSASYSDQSTYTLGMPRMFKTKLCKFYIQGNCPRGGECTFIHDDPQIQTSPHHPLYRTKECKYHLAGHCHQGDDCSFKHTGPAGQGTAILPYPARMNGNHDDPNGEYKVAFPTRPCKWYMQGTCFSGDKCTFSHDLSNASGSHFQRTTVCRFYNGTVTSCRNGDQCTYIHDQPSQFYGEHYVDGENGVGDESEEEEEQIVFKMTQSPA